MERVWIRHHVGTERDAPEHGDTRVRKPSGRGPPARTVLAVTMGIGDEPGLVPEFLTLKTVSKTKISGFQMGTGTVS